MSLLSTPRLSLFSFLPSYSKEPCMLHPSTEGCCSSLLFVWIAQFCTFSNSMKQLLRGRDCAPSVISLSISFRAQFYWQLYVWIPSQYPKHGICTLFFTTAGHFKKTAAILLCACVCDVYLGPSITVMLFIDHVCTTLLNKLIFLVYTIYWIVRASLV